jgi:dTMP kinase
MNPPNSHPGALIVIEGLDGSGTTTQADLLVAWLARTGVPAIVAREPSGGAIGVVVRQHLGRQVELGGPEAEALAFAADRMDHVVSEVVPALERGTTVVADRYYLSSLAYQALNCDLEWVREINRFALRPDLTIFLAVPPDVGMARFAGRATRERFEEDRAELARISDRYDAAIGALRAGGETITVIDGTRSPADVHIEIVRLAIAVLAPRYAGVAMEVGAAEPSTLRPTTPAS